MSSSGVKRAFRYRFHPTPEQAARLTRTLGCVRLVYDRALEERTRFHVTESRSMPCARSSAAWEKTDEPGFLTEVSSVPSRHPSPVVIEDLGVRTMVKNPDLARDVLAAGLAER